MRDGSAVTDFSGLSNLKFENGKLALIDKTKEGSARFTAENGSFTGTITVKASQVVDVVKDINLKHRINRYLKREKPYEQPISEADIRSLTEDQNSYKSSDIKDLTGIEYATQLKELRFFDNKIEDAKPLAGLTNLNDLDLGRNPISDATPLAGLTNLTALSLNGDKVSDVKPLAGLVNLEDLQLMKNGISDISALSGLTNITDLYM